MITTKPIRCSMTTWIVAGLALLGSTACTATVTARPARTTVLYDYPVVYVDQVPARVYDSPRVNYRGHPAYLVGSRWYYPTDRGWVYFAEEPRELRQERTTRQYRRAESRQTKGRYVDKRERAVDPANETRRRRYDSN